MLNYKLLDEQKSEIETLKREFVKEVLINSIVYLKKDICNVFKKNKYNVKSIFKTEVDGIERHIYENGNIIYVNSSEHLFKLQLGIIIDNIICNQQFFVLDKFEEILNNNTNLSNEEIADLKQELIKKASNEAIDSIYTDRDKYKII